MTFTLQVEFSGLCGYLRHPDDRQVGIVQPDGRLLRGTVIAADHDPLVPHAGYIRYNLADTGASVPGKRTSDESPSFEVIHRFEREEVDFGLDDQPMGQVNTSNPRVERFAPTVKPVPGLFSNNPPADLLMPCVLRGGSITSAPTLDEWRFSTLLNQGGQPYEDRFAGFTTWTRVVDADHLTITLKAFDGTPRTTITLTPRDPERIIKLKIANLCADNPLEWSEMFLRPFNAKFDVDFKWFYQLWQ